MTAVVLGEKMTPRETYLFDLGKKIGREDLLQQLHELLGTQELIDKAMEQHDED